MVRFEGKGGGIIPTPCLKPVRITLETSHLSRKYTPICSFRKYTFLCLGPLNFNDVSSFLEKNSIFCSKKYFSSRQKCESCVRDFVVLFSVSVRQKITITKTITIADSASGIRSLDCSKLTGNLKNDNDVTIFKHDAIFNPDYG